jgi:hypothetical protein
MTMPRAVRANLTLLVRKESMARLTISLKSIVFRAVSTNGVVIEILYWVPDKSLARQAGATAGTEDALRMNPKSGVSKKPDIKARITQRQNHSTTDALYRRYTTPPFITKLTF